MVVLEERHGLVDRPDRHDVVPRLPQPGADGEPYQPGVVQYEDLHL